MTTTDSDGLLWRELGIIGVLLVMIWVIGIVSPALGLPTTGAPTVVDAGDVTVPVTGATGTDAWITWGQNSGGECWLTPNNTPDGTGAVTVTISGSPLLGSTLYYAKACDQTGCGNEVSFTTSAVTPIPVTPFGNGFRNLTAIRFNPVIAAGTIFKAYTNIMPATVAFGMLFGVITIGMWMRNKSVRLIGLLMMIASPFIMSTGAGLYLGIPLAEQALGQALLAVGFAGIALSFVKP